MKLHNKLSPTQFAFSNGLRELLQQIEKLRNLSDEELAQPSPVNIPTGQPLAANRLEYNQDRILGTLQWLNQLIEKNQEALSKIPSSNMGELLHSLGRIKTILHPAQSKHVYRPGEVPQARHLDDVPPSPSQAIGLAIAAENAIETAREDVAAAAYKLVTQDNSSNENRLIEAKKQLKSTRNSIERHVAKNKSNPWMIDPAAERNHMIESNAFKRQKQRWQGFENAELFMKRFLLNLCEEKWCNLPEGQWKTGKWFEQATDYGLTQEMLRRAKADGVIENRKQKNEKGAYRSEERRVGKECRSRWSPYH